MKVNLQRRSEIGEERRRRTLEKILRAMVLVLSDKKFEDVNIEDFIETGRNLSRYVLQLL